MIVCSCNVLSDCQIRSTVDAQAGGARTPGQVYRCLGCSAQCGRCARTIKNILDAALGNCGSTASGCAGCPAHAHGARTDDEPVVGASVSEQIAALADRSGASLPSDPAIDGPLTPHL